MGPVCYDVVLSKVLAKASGPEDCTPAVLDLMALCCRGVDRVTVSIDKLWNFICLKPTAVILETLKKVRIFGMGFNGGILKGGLGIH